jgi:hypothetical protein
MDSCTNFNINSINTENQRLLSLGYSVNVTFRTKYKGVWNREWYFYAISKKPEFNNIILTVACKSIRTNTSLAMAFCVRNFRLQNFAKFVYLQCLYLIITTDFTRLQCPARGYLEKITVRRKFSYEKSKNFLEYFSTPQRSLPWI